LWFKANLFQIWGRLLGEDKSGKTNNSTHNNVKKQQVRAAKIKKKKEKFQK